jgi:DNA replicative helicase MCM subunit Mcm2 (Cdc46/Mcm family)
VSVAPVVVKDEANPEPDEILAKHILQMSQAMEKFNQGPLKRDTLVLLIHDHTKIARRDIHRVLDTLSNLKRIYCK